MNPLAKPTNAIEGAWPIDPWLLKMAAKFVLARFPGGARHWHRTGLFRHGAMTSPDYALKVLNGHLERAGLGRGGVEALTCLELGPGDSLFSALILSAYGAERALLVDVDDFACRDLGPYGAMAGRLAAEGLPVPSLAGVKDAKALLGACRADYLVKGLASLRSLPERSVDWIWSQAVLEHIRRAEFLDMQKELHRILKPNGFASHRIDLRDHLTGALNNLRAPEWLWEWQPFADSGFYTNRIQYSEMLELFEAAGFLVEVLGCRRWDSLPTPQKRLAARFRDLPETELAVRSFDVLLRPR